MKPERLNIKKEILIWAVERNGQSVDEYAKKNPSFVKWIEGEKLPTIKQLESFATQVHIPFGYLFLSEQPQESIPIPFFRTVDRHPKFNLKLYDTVIDLQRKQEWLSSYFRENDMDFARFIGSCVGKSVEETVLVARSLLEKDPDWALHVADSASVVRTLIDWLEEIGCFVSVQGYVGTYNKRQLAVADCRGFSLIDPYAPFIYVNNNDSKEAQYFTLIHEFAHLLIGFSSGYGSGSDNDDQREDFCDKVAAMFLVDGALLHQKWNGNIDGLARTFRVSKIMMARRAHEERLISDAGYRSYMDAYWAHVQEHLVKKESGNSGGDYYATTRRRLGFNFLVHISNAVKSNQLSYNDAYRLTGCHGVTFDKLISK
ncbi:MAG: ImmA/IrrE family metallo-endopeptidase [Bacteroidales bacterium]|nr:ImmA/IrrE family metallo-endopeptidase [Bacteroidales bacterium]